MNFANSFDLKTVILHITPGLITGGAERALVRLIQSSDKNRFKHRVVSLTDQGTQGAELEKAGVIVDVLRISGVYSAFKGILKLRKITRSVKPDVIHSWMYHGGLFALLAPRGSKRILGIRQALHDQSKDKTTTRFIIKLLALFSKRFNVITYNSHTSKLQHETRGYSPKNALVIHNGFDLTELYPNKEAGRKLRKAAGISDDVFVFGNISRHHPIKNHIGLLQAFSDVYHNAKNVFLLMAGPGIDSSNRHLTEIIKSQQLQNNVLLMGETNDVLPSLNACDVYVSSSFSEAFPNTIGEAMACGVPCIATDVGDCSYIIGKAGLIIPVNDHKALVNAMTKLFESTEKERKQLGVMALQRIQENFQIASMTQSYEELYTSLATKKR